MANKGPHREGRFVQVVGQGFPGIFLGARALRWTMPKTVLGEVASWRQLYLAATSSHVGGGSNMAGLAYPLHRPTTCSRQSRRQTFLSGAA
jgi:hypothetical protein